MGRCRPCHRRRYYVVTPKHRHFIPPVEVATGTLSITLGAVTLVASGTVITPDNVIAENGDNVIDENGNEVVA